MKIYSVRFDIGPEGPDGQQQELDFHFICKPNVKDIVGVIETFVKDLPNPYFTMAGHWPEHYAKPEDHANDPFIAANGRTQIIDQLRAQVPDATIFTIELIDNREDA